jgi:hypothetical protein
MFAQLTDQDLVEETGFIWSIYKLPVLLGPSK